MYYIAGVVVFLDVLVFFSPPFRNLKLVVGDHIDEGIM